MLGRIHWTISASALIIAQSLGGAQMAAAAPPAESGSETCGLSRAWSAGGAMRKDDSRVAGKFLNSISVRPDGQLLWNGNPAPRESIAKYLELIGHMNPTPTLILSGEAGTGCGAIEDAARFITEHHTCAAGACWHSTTPFLTSPPPPPPPPPRRPR